MMILFPKCLIFEEKTLWMNSCLAIHTLGSELFGMSSEIFGYGYVVLKNPGTSRLKVSCLWVRKSWQIHRGVEEFHPAIHSCSPKCFFLYVLCNSLHVDNLLWIWFTQVQFIIPNSSLGNVLQFFQGITPTQDHYSSIELPVHAFTEVEFIKTFIKNGNIKHAVHRSI